MYAFYFSLDISTLKKHLLARIGNILSVCLLLLPIAMRTYYDHACWFSRPQSYRYSPWVPLARSPATVDAQIMQCRPAEWMSRIARLVPASLPMVVNNWFTQTCPCFPTAQCPTACRLHVIDTYLVYLHSEPHPIAFACYTLPSYHHCIIETSLPPSSCLSFCRCQSIC